MNPRPIHNMAASVKQRLLNLAKKQGENFNFLLGRFTVERFLFRLSQSKHGEDAVKQTQWHAFARKIQMEENAHSLNEIIVGLQAFLIPPVEAILREEAFRKSWTPGGPWRGK